MARLTVATYQSGVTKIMSHSAAVEVVAASIDDKPVLRSLLELYQYDLSRFDKRAIGPSGQYGYRYLDHYWTDDERHPYLVRVDGQWAGFVRVNRYSPLGEQVWSVAQFFVLAAYRRSSYGESVATGSLASIQGHGISPWTRAIPQAMAPGAQSWTGTPTAGSMNASSMTTAGKDPS